MVCLHGGMQHAAGYPPCSGKETSTVHTMWMALYTSCALRSQVQRPHTVYFYSYDILEKQIKDCQGLEEGVNYKGTQGSSGGWWHCSVSRFWWWLHDYMQMSELPDLDTKKSEFYCM